MGRSEDSRCGLIEEFNHKLAEDIRAGKHKTYTQIGFTAIQEGKRER